MVKRKSKVNMRKYTPERNLSKILEVNNIHPFAVVHWKETRDGDMLIQFRFDDIVKEFCGIHGHYKKSVVVQKWLFRKPPKKKIKRRKKR